MLIREIIIDGFGKFANTRITGFSSGVNVIYGPNEYGKTTFLDFIRRILFGFPRSSSSTNPYPPLRGGAYGGKLTCDLDNGETVTISRTEGTHGGKVAIQKGATELKDQDAVNSLLGHISGTFYENVYAISLDELQAIQSLNTDEVKNRIYGVGLGLGSISLTNIKIELLDQQEKLFKARGSIQKIPILYSEIRDLERGIKEIQNGLSIYDSLVVRSDELIEEIGTLDDVRNKLEANKQLLENQKKLYPTYVNLKNVESELSQLDESADLPENAIEKIDNLNTDLKYIQKRKNENVEGLRTLEATQENLTYNKKLIDLEPDVITLQQSIEIFRSANKDIDKEKSKRNTLHENNQKEIEKLGKGWSEEQINQFNLTHEEEDSITSIKERLSKATGKIESARNKLELHKEHKSAELSKGFSGPDFYRFVIYVITILGLIGIVFGLYSSQWSLTGFSSLIFIIGIIVALKIKTSGQLDAIDPLELKYTETLEQEENEYRTIELERSEFLKRVNLKESLTLEVALDIIKLIKNIQTQLSSLNQYDERIGNMHKTIDMVKEIHDRVASVIDKSKIGSDVSANIELFQRQLSDSKGIKNQREVNETLTMELKGKIENLEKEKQMKEKEIRDHISSLNATNEDDLRNKYHLFMERTKLIGNINEFKRIIQSIIGLGEHYDSFIKSLTTTTPDNIERDLREVESEKKERVKERDEKNRTIGELKIQIEELASHQDLLVKQSELELKKQQLKNFSLEWAKFQIAKVMLSKAISEYENTRQPQVIKVAEDIFSSLTNNTYPTITKPIDRDELMICDKSGNRKGVLEMSRGTKEQLYFAMRLGLIKVYESQTESMPIIMDDILVNFDDERGPLAIEALNNFATERQVIVFTCHKNMSDLYIKFGANQVTIS